jgi:hypothetical protein
VGRADPEIRRRHLPPQRVEVWTGVALAVASAAVKRNLTTLIDLIIIN